MSGAIKGSDPINQKMDLTPLTSGWGLLAGLALQSVGLLSIPCCWLAGQAQARTRFAETAVAPA